MKNFQIIQVIFTAIVSVQTSPPASISEKEFVRDEAYIRDFPWQVAILIDNILLCGGSLIEASHILTVAHCLNEHRNIHDYFVRAGSSYKSSGGFVSGIKSAIVHPQYNGETVDYDIAVIVTERPFPFSDVIQPIRIAYLHDNIYAFTEGVISGWGSSEEMGLASEHLRSIQLPIVQREKCEEKYSRLITLRMFCAGPQGKTDSCHGDSGGGFVVKNNDGERILLGIVSWGYGCARPDQPGVYTSIPALYSWIMKTLGSANAKVKMMFN